MAGRRLAVLRRDPRDQRIRPLPGQPVGQTPPVCGDVDPAATNGATIPVNDTKSGVPPPVAAAAEAELARLRSRVGGQAEIQRELDMNAEIAGECYLVGMGARVEEVRQRDGETMLVETPEDWQIRSISEVTMEGGRFFIRDSPGSVKGKPLDPERDTIIRIWQRHPRWSQSPDSPMRALLTDCATLMTLTYQVQAEANSRRSAGILLVPNELSFGGPDPTIPEDGMDDQAMDPFAIELRHAIEDPINDPQSAASVQPLIVRGPGEHLTPDMFRHIDLGTRFRGGRRETHPSEGGTHRPRTQPPHRDRAWSYGYDLRECLGD